MERSGFGRRHIATAHTDSTYERLPRRKEVVAMSGNPSLFSGSPHILIALAFMCMLMLLTNDTDGDVEVASVPQRITHVVNEPGQLVRPPTHPPSLRGCCGDPAEFHWVFLDGAGTAVGNLFHTRVFALDAQGRQARPSACGELRVDVELSGQARLSPFTPVQGWRNAELRLDIENHLAEVVDAEVRIESPNSNADILLHSSQIRFASGPASTFFIRVQHPGAYFKASADPGSQQDDMFPTNAHLEVFVITHDRFGNQAKLTGGEGSSRKLDLAGLGRTLVLRSNSRSLEFSPKDGQLHLNPRTSEGRASLSCKEAGAVDIWLEAFGSHVTRDIKESLRNRTLRRLSFFETASAKTVEQGEKKENLLPSDEKWRPVAEEVRQAFLTTWRTYRKYAWGRDELMPLSKMGKNSFGGIGMTILDSLTTLWIMGLTVEFEQAAAFVEGVLDFDNADEEISVFELIIRGVGGLLGAHSLSGRPIFLVKATELAERLLPALNSSSHLPWPKWNIARAKGSFSGDPTILAEAGSMQLEFRYLSAQTGDTRFKRAGDACFEAIQSTGVTGLAPVYLTPPDHTPPRALSSKYAIGALADSYYEYLIKQYIQTPSEAYFKDLWLSALDEVPGLLRPRPEGLKRSHTKPPQFKLIEVAPGGEAIWKMDHLSCFAPAMIVLGLHTLPERDLVEKGRNDTWWKVADGLVDSCMELWTSSRSGLAPEFAKIKPASPFNFHEVPENARHSFLRPETVESLFYFYRFTGDEKYRESGEKIFRAMMEHGKVDAGFASVKDVNQIPTEKIDEMQSFVMAETLKYLYLLFSPADALDLDRFVLNTEGHPLRLSKQ